MATKYSDVYDRALSKMREYVFIDMEDEQVYNVLSVFLKGAISEFSRICEDNLEDVNEEGFIADLSEECIEILAIGIVFYWTTAYVADADKWRNLLGTKDFSVFSPANLLGVTRDTRNNFELEFKDKMNRYSFLHGDLIREQVKG